MEIIMLTVLFLAVFVLFVFFAVRSGRIQNLLKKYPQLPKYIVLGYTVFCGCFEYPLLNRHSSTALDFSRLYLFFVSYGLIAFLFSRIYGIAKERQVYALTFLFTAIGMVGRYFLEFGEVSNTYNFTLINIVSYLLIIPTGTTIAYHFISRGMRK